MICSDKPVALVTGGTSGIGFAAAEALKRKGYSVSVISRKRPVDFRFSHYSADVSDEVSVRNAVNEIVNAEGRLDLLVNCAGFGISGAVEFTDLASTKRQFDVNFFGVVNATKAVLPVFRKQSGGRIINVSSVAAPIPIPFQTFYSASKAAINAYSLALANEVRPFGISVCTVQPGDIQTGFTAARAKNCAGDDVYGGRISRSVAVMESDETHGMPPSAVGDFIGKIAVRKRIGIVYTVGWKYRVFCLLVRLLPSGLVNQLVGSIYGG